jgi:diguanylate cyclase (GGDEF)-like protein
MAEAGTQEQRRQSRHTVEGFCSNLGSVVDLSRGGARILARRAISGEQTLTLRTHQHGKLVLQSKVMWHRRLDRGRHLVGVQFKNLTRQDTQALGSLVDQISRGFVPKSKAGVAGTWLGIFLAALGIAVVAANYLRSSIADRMPEGWEQVAQWLEGPVSQWSWVGYSIGVVMTVIAINEIRGQPPVDKRQSARDRRGASTPGRRNESPQDEIARLRRSQLVLNGILESSLGGVIVLKAVRHPGSRAVIDLEIQLANPAAEDLIGKSEQVLIGQRVSEVLPCITKNQMYQDLLSVAESGLPLQKHYRIDSNSRWYQLAVVQISDGLAVTFADTTDQHQAQAQLRHVAYHDELTGLPNRKLLMEHLETAFQRSKRHPSHQSAVLFLDFDRFKFVNDTLGHDVGDLLLIGIAERLRDNLRAVDVTAMAGQEQVSARLGGDEFVVMLDGISGKEDAVVVARRLLEAFNQPHDLDGHTVISTASIGIAMSRPDYKTVDELLRDADTAMYQAKHSGKARYVVFDQHMHEQLIEQAALEEDLRDAIERETFTLVYEPIVDMQDGQISGFEALIRWSHPSRGDVSPEQFIPLAEELNLIKHIDAWVMRNAIAELAHWIEANQQDVFVNINLSRTQLHDVELPSIVEGLLDRYQLPPDSVRFEITETMVMNDTTRIVEVLNRLKNIGVQIALDDFGTGHSSLNMLQDLPLDILKIDRTFIENAGQAVRRYGAIIATITELAQNLDMIVIAEGIERSEQVALLQTLNCDYAQGWLFSQPLNGDQALDLLQSHDRYELAA